MRQHPDGRRCAACRCAEGGQVGRDGPAGQVDDGHLPARGEPVGGGHGQHRRPAGQRAARDVHPVDAVGNGDGVPPLLAREGGPLLLPLAGPLRVLGLRLVQPGLLVRAEPLDPHPLGIDPPPQYPLPLPDRVAAQPCGQQAGGDGRRGDDGGHPPGGDAGRERERDHGRRAGREPQWPPDEAFFPALRRQPVAGQRLPLGRNRPARRRSRIGGRGRVLPPQVQRGHVRLLGAGCRARQPGRHYPARRDEPLSRPAHREDELRLAERQQGPRRDHRAGDKIRRGARDRARDCREHGSAGRHAAVRGHGSAWRGRHRPRGGIRDAGRTPRRRSAAGAAACRSAWRGWRPGPGRRRDT